MSLKLATSIVAECRRNNCRSQIINPSQVSRNDHVKGISIAACAREYSWSLIINLIFFFFLLPVSPLPIVAVSLVLTGADSYAANNCWLTIEYGIIYWPFVVPVAIIVLVSGVLFKLFILWLTKHFHSHAIGLDASLQN